MRMYKRVDLESAFSDRWFDFEQLRDYVIEEIELHAEDEDLDENGNLKQEHLNNLQTEKQLISWAAGWYFGIEVFDTEKDEDLERLWDDLTDIPFDEDNDKELVLGEDWFIFSVGDVVFDIHRWFDKHHSKGVGYLMYGTNSNRDKELKEKTKYILNRVKKYF